MGAGAICRPRTLAAEDPVSPNAPLPYDRAGSGAPLLLLHGVMVDRGYWRPLLGRLAEHFDVIACDLPGHGEAPALAGPTSAAAVARAVIATLDALGLPSAAVLGHSFGGMVAQELARQAPGRVDSLVLADTWCNPRGFLFEPLPFRTVALHWLLRVTPVPQMAELMAAGVALRTPAIAPYARRAMARFAAEPASYLWLWDAATDFNSYPWLAQIGCPTLVLAAADYPLTTVQARELAARIPGARLAVIPRSGHWLSWDNPEAFADAVLTFLAEPRPA
jgi:pimeloyl-ACP methyl ester carboxylesterase